MPYPANLIPGFLIKQVKCLNPVPAAGCRGLFILLFAKQMVRQACHFGKPVFKMENNSQGKRQKKSGNDHLLVERMRLCVRYLCVSACKKSKITWLHGIGAEYKK